MSDAWEILVEHSAAGDAWERLNSLTGGTGETVLVDVFNSTTFSESVQVATFTQSTTESFIESVVSDIFVQADQSIFTEIDAGEL
jgi:hypothetical protein